MKVDVSKSVYEEIPEARNDYNRMEIRHLRTGLRRLRFLEAQVREHGGLGSGNGGAAFAEWEVASLEFMLTELGFIRMKEGRKAG
jgi:hypothetical protein